MPGQETDSAGREGRVVAASGSTGRAEDGQSGQPPTGKPTSNGRRMHRSQPSRTSRSASTSRVSPSQQPKTHRPENGGQHQGLNDPVQECVAALDQPQARPGRTYGAESGQGAQPKSKTASTTQPGREDQRLFEDRREDTEQADARGGEEERGREESQPLRVARSEEEGRRGGQAEIPVARATEARTPAAAARAATAQQTTQPNPGPMSPPGQSPSQGRDREHPLLARARAAPSRPAPGGQGPNGNTPGPGWAGPGPGTVVTAGAGGHAVEHGAPGSQGQWQHPGARIDTTWLGTAARGRVPKTRTARAVRGAIRPSPAVRGASPARAARGHRVRPVRARGATRASPARTQARARASPAPAPRVSSRERPVRARGARTPEPAPPRVSRQTREPHRENAVRDRGAVARVVGHRGRWCRAGEPGRDSTAR